MIFKLIVSALATWALIKLFKTVSAWAERLKNSVRANHERINSLEVEQVKMRIAESVAWGKQLEINAKQAEINRKHDEEIAKLNFKIEKATKDIEDLTEELSKKYALLDLAQNQQMMAVPGSKADESAQKKIIAYEKSIRIAERQLDKAKFDKELAERKLA